MVRQFTAAQPIKRIGTTDPVESCKLSMTTFNYSDDEALQELVTRMVHREETSISELRKLTKTRLEVFLQRRLSNRHDVEEALQDVYMQAWQNADLYTSERASVWSWLYMIARSRAIDRMRRVQRDVVFHEAKQGNGLRTAALMANASHHLHNEVVGALSRLSSTEREIIYLAFYEGLTHTEISSCMTTPLGTVKTRIRTAIFRMRKELMQRQM